MSCDPGQNWSHPAEKNRGRHQCLCGCRPIPAWRQRVYCLHTLRSCLAVRVRLRLGNTTLAHRDLELATIRPGTCRQEQAHSVDETARGSGQIGVFLLDDHEIVRMGVRDLLEAEADITVVGEAGTAESALARIPAHHTTVAAGTT